MQFVLHILLCCDAKRLYPLGGFNVYKKPCGLEGHPGDEYVDIFGLDNYFDLDGVWNKANLYQL